MNVSVSDNTVLLTGAAGAFLASFVTSLLNWYKLGDLGNKSDQLQQSSLSSDAAAAEAKRESIRKIDEIHAMLMNIEGQVNERTIKIEMRLKSLEDSLEKIHRTGALQ